MAKSETDPVESSIKVADTVVVADTQEAADALALQILSDFDIVRSED